MSEVFREYPVFTFQFHFNGQRNWISKIRLRNFERQIRTIRKILNALLTETSHLIKITDDVLSTLFCEIENILNSRPLTAISTENDDQMILTPNHILRLSNTTLFPPGVFEKRDISLKRKWRQAQYVANLFFDRYKKEYLTELQQRSKWFLKERSHEVGDIVLITDQATPRNDWSTGIITKVKKGSDGLVRTCEVATLKNKFDTRSFDKKTLLRPITKLILLIPSND